jgi:transcriptional regulator with XRE-family HTH domain
VYLKRRRRELGLTQAQVAQKLQRSRTWVGKVEQRERRLDVIEVQQLCDLLGMAFSEVEAMLAEKERP